MPVVLCPTPFDLYSRRRRELVGVVSRAWPHDDGIREVFWPRESSSQMSIQVKVGPIVGGEVKEEAKPLRPAGLISSRTPMRLSKVPPARPPMDIVMK